MSFRLTYATMFNPPEAMHERFEAALADGAGPPRAGPFALHRRPGPRGAGTRAAAQPDRPQT